MEKEKIALLIGSGKNTYADFSKAFPSFSNETWMSIIFDNFKNDPPNPLIKRYTDSLDNMNNKFIFFKEYPDDYSPAYEFKPTDSFKLSTNGKNLLHQLKKERQQLLLTIASVAFSALATITGVLALLR